MTQIPHIVNGNGTISLLLDGKMRPIDTAHKNYNQIMIAVKAQDWDVIPDLVNIAETVEKAINASTAAGRVTISNGEVLYDGTAIHNTLIDRIVTMAEEGFDIGFMVKFLENLMQNPSFRAVQELYDFLASGGIPITENGTFMAYKKIRDDWMDIYTGRIDNSIGAVVQMPRNMVDEDSSVTCSKGLHVCSYTYLAHYGSSDGDRVVLVEVNPRDVVSIPKDYNNTKMRVCEYTVISEVENYTENDPLALAAVFTMAPEDDGDDITWEAAKAVGKRVTQALRYEEITPEKLEDAGLASGLSKELADKLSLIARDDPKRAGKKVARWLFDEVMIVEDFEAALWEPEAEAPEKCDDRGDCTCGKGNAPAVDTSKTSDVKCSRCGSTTQVDKEDGYCRNCHFYND